MDLNQLDTFLVLAEELHFGRTAERLRIDQSKVSRLIAALEREIGGPLFARTSRRVALTPLGARLRAEIEPAHAQLHAAVARARTDTRCESGRLRLGFTASTGGEALNELVTAVESYCPTIDVELRESPMFDVYGPLRRNAIDVLVNWLDTDQHDLTVGPAIDLQHRVLAVGAHHPLASARSVSAEALAELETIAAPDVMPSSLFDRIVPPRTPAGLPIRRLHPAIAMSEVWALVALGRIVHPTVRSMAATTHRQDIVFVPLRGLPPLPLVLLWSSAHENARIRAIAQVAERIGPPSR